MTAKQIIDEIKSLPTREQAEVIEFVHHLESDQAKKKTPENDEEFKAAADRVLSNHAELMRKLAQ